MTSYLKIHLTIYRFLIKQLIVLTILCRPVGRKNIFFYFLTYFEQCAVLGENFKKRAERIATHLNEYNRSVHSGLF